jgi:hypothetical protein
LPMSPTITSFPSGRLVKPFSPYRSGCIGEDIRQRP